MTGFCRSVIWFFAVVSPSVAHALTPLPDREIVVKPPVSLEVQVPVLLIGETYFTESAKVTISGGVDFDSGILVYSAGGVDSPTSIRDGNFSFPVSLRMGSNQIELKSKLGDARFAGSITIVRGKLPGVETIRELHLDGEELVLGDSLGSVDGEYRTDSLMVRVEGSYPEEGKLITLSGSDGAKVTEEVLNGAFAIDLLIKKEGKTVYVIDVSNQNGSGIQRLDDLTVSREGSLRDFRPTIAANTRRGELLTRNNEGVYISDYSAFFVNGELPFLKKGQISVQVGDQEPFSVGVYNGKFSQAVSQLEPNRLYTVRASYEYNGVVLKDSFQILWELRDELKVILTWDKSVDMDLHVKQPGGNTVNFQNKKIPGGGELSIDNTRGFSRLVSEGDTITNKPEEYTLSSKLGHNVVSGEYEIFVIFYGGEAQSVNCRLQIIQDGEALAPMIESMTKKGQRWNAIKIRIL